VFVGAGTGVSVGSGVSVGCGVDVGTGVLVATGVLVGGGVGVAASVGVFVGAAGRVLVGATVGVPLATTVGVPLATTVGVVVPAVGDPVMVGVTVTTPPNTVALAQSLATLPSASSPAVQALLVNSPGLVMVAETVSCVDAPAGSPPSNIHSTYPVSGSTAAVLLALTTSTSLGRAEATSRAVRSTLPVFVTV
jgi:hypothetical protein